MLALLCRSRAAEKEPVVSTGYEVTSKDLEIERFGAGGFEGLPRNGGDQGYTLEALRLRLTRVVRRGDAPVLCYVERDRAGLNRLNPVYRCGQIHVVRAICVSCNATQLHP